MKHLLILACIVLGMSACGDDKQDDPVPQTCETVASVTVVSTSDGDKLYKAFDEEGNVIDTEWAASRPWNVGDVICQ